VRFQVFRDEEDLNAIKTRRGDSRVGISISSKLVGSKLYFFTSTKADEDIATVYIFINSKVMQLQIEDYAN